MQHHLLWLDDYFEDFGELIPHDPDLELQADFARIKRRFPNTKFHPQTTLSGFVQQVLDHERMAYGIEPKNPGACKLDAIIVDIMIDNADRVPIPKINEQSQRVIFGPNGLVEDWLTLRFNKNGNDAGLKLCEHFLRKLSSLQRTAIIFYTHRPINEQIADVIQMVKNASFVVGHAKLKGIEPLYSALDRAGLK